MQGKLRESLRQGGVFNGIPRRWSIFRNTSVDALSNFSLAESMFRLNYNLSLRCFGGLKQATIRL
jgi:hypothetical protein